MDDKEFRDLQISGWWGFATIALVVAGGAMIIAKMIGPEAVNDLMNFSLISVFIVGGVLLGLLATQALGSSQLWGLAENSEAPVVPVIEKKHSTSLSEFAEEAEGVDGESDQLDPFYEILKQKRTGRNAA